MGERDPKEGYQEETSEGAQNRVGPEDERHQAEDAPTEDQRELQGHQKGECQASERCEEGQNGFKEGDTGAAVEVAVLRHLEAQDRRE